MSILVVMAVVGGYNAAPKFDFCRCNTGSPTSMGFGRCQAVFPPPGSRTSEGNGLSRTCPVQSTSVSPDGMSVDIQNLIERPAQMRVDAATARAGIRQATCANYMGSLLGQSGVKLKTRFVHPDKERCSLRHCLNQTAQNTSNNQAPCPGAHIFG